MSSSQIPATIGRYEIVKLIGRGAVGQVFLARDPSLDRHVAIKMLAIPDDDESTGPSETHQRFLREAQAAAGLSHPNIVTIFDVGEHQGQPYIAMEYLEGTPLDRYTSPKNLLPAGKVLEVLIQAAMALDHSHRAGIVHRDIKPANLVLLGDGTLKVADFGLAKDPSTSLTAHQTLVGTPNYMSPEQVAGKKIDGRSDLFSLAVSGYELLTGHLPFPGDTVASVLYRIVNERPVRLQDHRDDLPEELVSTLERGMAKNPEDRPSTGAELALALRPVFDALGGVPDVSLPSPGPAPQPPPATKVAPPRAEGASADDARRGGRGASLGGKILRIAVVALVLLVVLAGAGLTAPRWSGWDPLGETRSDVDAWLSANLGAFGNLLRGTPPEVRVRVTADEPVERLALAEGSPGVLTADAAGYELVLRLDAERPARVVVEDPCREGVREISPDTGERAFVVPTEPVFVDVPVASEPKGASIAVDDELRAEKTPTTLTLRACEAHTVELKVSGREDATVGLAADESLDAWKSKLASVEIPEIPPARVRLPDPGYPATVYVEDVGAFEPGQRVSVPPGRRNYSYVNDELLVRVNHTMTAGPGDDVRLDIVLPKIGTINFISVPSSKLSIEDRRGRWKELGSTPINGKRLAAGTYTVRFEPPKGQTVERKIEVRPGRNEPVAVGRGDFGNP
jgi:predicted Ser/Thr protein kinase